MKCFQVSLIFLLNLSLVMTPMAFASHQTRIEKDVNQLGSRVRQFAFQFSVSSSVNQKELIRRVLSLANQALESTGASLWSESGQHLTRNQTRKIKKRIQTLKQRISSERLLQSPLSKVSRKLFALGYSVAALGILVGLFIPGVAWVGAGVGASLVLVSLIMDRVVSRRGEASIVNWPF